MDTVKQLALHRHFYTAEIQLAAYGTALLIGDQEAVEHLLTITSEHAEHDLVAIETEQPPDQPPSS